MIFLQENKDKKAVAKNKKPLFLILLVVLVLIIGMSISASFYLKQRSNQLLFQNEINNKDVYFKEAASGLDSAGKGLSLEKRIASYQKAENSFGGYLQKNPNDTDALEKMAGIYYNLEKYDLSIATYQKLISIKPDNALYYTNMAHAYLAKKDTENAKQGYQKSISLDSKLSVNYIGLANIYKSEGKKDEGIKIIDEGLAKNPGNYSLIDFKNSF